jgi:predicted ArsR family transcriptional regulator
MPKRKAKPAPRYADQPAVAAILKLVQSRRGATVAEIAKARGLQPHTVRSVLSRLGSKAGLVLTRTKFEGRSRGGQGDPPLDPEGIRWPTRIIE